MMERKRYKGREEIQKEELGEAEVREVPLKRRIIKLEKELAERDEIDKMVEDLLGRDWMEEVISGIKARKKPSFSTIEEWLKEVIIDPSFFLFDERFRMLFQILGGLKPKAVIIPSDFDSILRTRYKEDRIISHIEEKDYYPILIEFITQWETPTKVKRQETLKWISSANFWSLVSSFLRYSVVPASRYLSEYQKGRFEGSSGFNPVNIREATKVLGETAGWAFYEMIAVCETTERAIVSSTRGLVRLCRRLRLPTYESYLEWKRDFRRKYRLAKDFFLIATIAAGAALAVVLRKVAPCPIPEVVSSYTVIKISDG